MAAIPASADAVVDEDLPLAVDHQHAPQREVDAIARVGGEVALPERARDDAEHRAAIESDGAVAHFVDAQVTQLERHDVSFARTSVLGDALWALA